VAATGVHREMRNYGVIGRISYTHLEHYYNSERKLLFTKDGDMIAAEIFEAREKLEKMFPSLEFRVVRSGRRWRSFCVGVRPRFADSELHVWLWTPMDNFPDDELQLKLSLIDTPRGNL
jgi:hypothetical protein